MAHKKDLHYWRENLKTNCVKIKNPKKFNLDQIPTPKASVTSVTCFPPTSITVSIK